MNKINEFEMTRISGGLVPPTNIYPAMPAGVALTTFRGLGYVGSAFAAGFAFGEWLNENTDIQAWISAQIAE